MPAEEIFLPFWKFMGLIFVYYILIELLKDIGLIKSK